MENLTVACQFRQRGLFVVPVDSESRLPLVKWGDIDRLGYRPGGKLHVGEGLPYSSLLFEWWHRWPGAGAAVLCGLSRLLVIDCDPRHGGHRSLAALCAEIELPATLVIGTRHQGCHLYYRVPRPVRSGTSVLGKGLDVLSYRKLATAPPTPGYSVLVDRRIADAPPALLARCPRPDHGSGSQRERLPLDDPTAQAALAYALERIGAAGEGERHDRLYGQARHLFNTTTDSAVDALLLEAARRIGLPEVEARRTVSDARRAAGG